VNDPILPRVVTMSSLYGTRDVEIGRRVAERLGVAFVDREIPAFVARQLGLPEEAVTAYDERPRGVVGRVMDALGRAPVPSMGRPQERLDTGERHYRAEVESFLARTAASGGVILGRAGAVVLQAVPGALHVRLVGPETARVRQAMEREGIDAETAERRLRENDRARADYGRMLYRVDPDDADLYHLVIDSTAIDVDTCVELIAAASNVRIRDDTTHSPRHEQPRRY
jgi:cytidylate kinase